jgi:hypothetical protein
MTSTITHEKRARAISMSEYMENNTAASQVQSMDLTLNGIRGKYSGSINEEGRPHGTGSFVRDEGGMRYVGTWKDGERFGSGEYYNEGGTFLGNVVWE